MKNEIARNSPEPGNRSHLAVASAHYDTMAPHVLGLIAQILTSRKEAEEVLQQVFLRLENEPQVLNQHGFSVGVWLMLEARTAALERLHAQVNENNAVKQSEPKSAKALPKTAGGESKKRNHAGPAVLKPEWLPDPETIGRVNERLEILHRAVDQLPPEQRRALDLAIFGGRSEAEIAVELGEPLGKVQRSLRAAVTFVKHRCRAVGGTWSANI